MSEVWLVNLLILFTGASLLLYVVLGGADYGAGILELLPSGEYRERQKKLINVAMGPVWEANHMWLIILVVILFMGFPLAFQVLMTSLHLPVVALLVGIVVRGAVFTFRHYDAVKDDRSQRIYTALFCFSSLWTSIWLGVIAASLFRGQMVIDSRDFHEAYVAPWWGLFPFTMGLFVSATFAYLASLYLVGESTDKELMRFFSRRAFIFNCLVVVLGAAVFFTSWLDGVGLVEDFVASPLSLACLAGATTLFLALWLASSRHHVYLARILAAGQVTLILLGWYFVHAPRIFVAKGAEITFYQAAAPKATLLQLAIALLVGSIFIFPSLFYLLKVFKSHPGAEDLEPQSEEQL